MCDKLKPCQCGGEAVDRGHGIECRNCGIWLGNGTQAERLGGYIKAWNTRTPPEHKYATQGDAWMGLPPLSDFGAYEGFCRGFNAARELKEK
jgi:hypothetical protein